jgi:hypothetical protein
VRAVGNIEFPDTVAGAAHGAGEAFLDGVQGRFRALQVRDIDNGAGDAVQLAVAIVRDRRGLGHPALAAIRQQYPVLAGVGRRFGRGPKRGAANLLEVVGMHGGEMTFEIVQAGVGGDAQHLMKVRRGHPTLVAEIQVHGDHAGDRLGDVQGFGGLA